MARYIFVVILMAGLLASCGFKRKKYDNPITKDTKQPDKVLFDRAINDIEHGRYEVARITLNTLINTYDQSEFLAKAKLAVADSWFREGGAAGLAQAEAEYKDFILFYPTMEEAAESQQKVCMIHYKQMDKADRDPNQALRAEDECRQLIVQFPNSKFVEETQQLLRNIQEALADAEYQGRIFLLQKRQQFRGRQPLHPPRGSISAVQQGRRSTLGSGRLLFAPRESFSHAGRRGVCPHRERLPAERICRQRQEKTARTGDAGSGGGSGGRSPYEWEKENRLKPGMVSKSTGFLRRGPDVSAAARSGAPAMTTLRPTVPLSVPQTGGAWLYRRCDGHHGQRFHRARYQTGCARESAGYPGSPAPPRHDHATQQTQTASRSIAESKKKKKEKKPKPADTTQPATAVPASPPSSSSDAQALNEPYPAGGR